MQETRISATIKGNPNRRNPKRPAGKIRSLAFSRSSGRSPRTESPPAYPSAPFLQPAPALHTVRQRMFTPYPEKRPFFHRTGKKIPQRNRKVECATVSATEMITSFLYDADERPTRPFAAPRTVGSYSPSRSGFRPRRPISDIRMCPLPPTRTRLAPDLRYYIAMNIRKQDIFVIFARKDNSLRINRLVGLLENWVTR